MDKNTIKTVSQRILPPNSLDIVGLLVLLPVLVELVHLARHVALLFEVECFVHLAESALTQKHQQQVAFVQHRMVVEPRLVLVVDTF